MFITKKKWAALEKRVFDLCNAALDRIQDQDRTIEALSEMVAEIEDIQERKNLNFQRKLIIVEKLLKDEKIDQGQFDIIVN